ncbi:phosphodiester glycosidase family protein [Halobacillus massiliensis]|uniref:phosphodiester glycosidase family protein n=1 Tax=Halobacillus massiliensis TaxID=1926286 RepID=UPI0009E347AB|nr:phosphodiester glycosidase family protein [Halobacillus massiliensis]
MYKNLFKSTLAALSILAIMQYGEVNAQSQQAVHHDSLTIGKGKLPETRTITELTRGVTHTEITRGYQSDKAFYTVDVDFFNEKKSAMKLAKELKKDGYRATVHKIDHKHRKSTDVDSRKIGYVVRTGFFTNEEEAARLASRVKEEGYEGAKAVYSEYDGTKNTKGPWQLDVIEINPGQFDGELTSGLAQDKIQERETISSMAERMNAIAGINGGYFVVGSKDGIPGDPAGTYVMDGELISESIGERSSLLISNNKAEVSEVSTELSLELEDGTHAIVDGVNRKPGLIRSCGGIGDSPGSEPRHDVTCTDDSEIIQFNRYFGENTPKGNGFEALINENGKVLNTYEELGHEIPDKGTVISATGEQARWLQNHVEVEDTLKLTEKIKADGKRLNLTSSLDVIGGGPQLLNDGAVNIQAEEEGFRWSNDFYYHFAQYRHPRTLAGVKDNGNILLVTVDGRNPKESIGLSFYESAQVLKSLGAVDGLNLDGGGSTSMAINDQLVNFPSDPSGERPVSDGIFLIK